PISPGAMLVFVEKTMIGMNARPTPPSVRRSHAAMSWKVDPLGMSWEYAGGRVAPTPCCAVAPVFSGASPRALPAARGRCREVRVVPLHREVRERPVVVHVLDDLAHGRDQARVVHGVVLVERHTEGFVVDRATDRLHLASRVGDVLINRRDGGHGGIA